MGIKENHYNAFISYRHSELDSKVAIEVHRKLERFKLPANIRKNFPKDHQKIERVFRDQDELPLADNLSDPIEQALRNSDYLIVICSPRLPESKWCQREMEIFKKMHGQDRILAILAEGEPEESFPDAICYKDVVSKDENGNEVINKITVEPLAADVRADSPRKRSAMINDAVLRLAAPMFNLGYDDLKQRHREQRIKRIAIATSIAAGVSVILGLIFMCLALKINSQKKVIESQHAELEKQYDIQQKKYCESMNIVSEDLLKQGLKKEAVYAIRSAMPDSEKDDSKPLLPSNIKTLTQILNIYDLNVFVPSNIIPVDDFDTSRFDSYYGNYDFLVEYMGGQTIMCSGQYDRDHILLITDSCRFFLYDTEENVLLDYTRGLFNNPPEGYVFGAAYEDGKIFIQFNDADYVSCFEIKTPDGLETAGQIAVKDIRTSRGLNIVEDGEDIISDDGEYVMRLGINHSLEVYKADEDEPFKILYDIRGDFYDLISADNGNKYILRGVGSSSLLFNEEFDIIAEIPYFYECADDGMIVLYTVADDAAYYDLYYVPLADYDDLIDEADKELKGFKPSEEFLGKYKMLDNKTEDSVGDIE